MQGCMLLGEYAHKRIEEDVGRQRRRRGVAQANRLGRTEGRSARAIGDT